MAARKLRILCLHGYRQDGDTLYSKLGSLRRSTKSIAEYSFVTAPQIIDGNDKERGWWVLEKDRHSDAQKESNVNKEVDESIRLVSEVVRKEGPFDGILGFSQGVTIAAMVLQLDDATPDDSEQARFRFALFYSGSASVNVKIPPEKKIAVPTLHVVGRTDRVIPIDRAIAIGESFTNLKRYEHDGGHFIPNTGDLKKEVFNFLKSFSEKCCEDSQQLEVS